jgi:hypothetical protein
LEVIYPSGQRVDSLRVRCPRCSKLYLVQTRDIRDTRPRFECTSCLERFWFSFVDGQAAVFDGSIEEIMGLKESQIESPSPKSETESCPKCHAEMAGGSAECLACGVIPSKYLGLKSVSRIQGSERLSQLWKRIIDDYPNEQTHDEFLRVSSMENNLAYAGGQYAQLLKVLPGDEMATRKLKEIEALVSIPVRPPPGMRVRAVKPATPHWINIVLAFGALTIMAGIFFVPLHNLTGIGAVVLFLTLGFRLRIFKY